MQTRLLPCEVKRSTVDGRVIFSKNSITAYVGLSRITTETVASMKGSKC